MAMEFVERRHAHELAGRDAAHVARDPRRVHRRRARASPPRTPRGSSTATSSPTTSSSTRTAARASSTSASRARRARRRRAGARRPATSSATDGDAARFERQARARDADPDRRGGRHARVHGARAVPRRARRRAQRSVQLLRRAVRGALRRAAVRGRRRAAASRSTSRPSSCAPLPKDRGVPAWMRRMILRGLEADPAARWPSMAALIAALEDDPAVSCGGASSPAARSPLVVATLLVAGQMVSRRRAEAEREIARHVAEANRAAGAARAKAARARAICAPRRSRRSTPSIGTRASRCGSRRARWCRRSTAASITPRSAFETAFMLDQLARRASRAGSRTCRTSTCCSPRTFACERRRRCCGERLAAVDGDGSRRKRAGRAGHPGVARPRRPRRTSCSSGTIATRPRAAGTRSRSVRFAARCAGDAAAGLVPRCARRARAGAVAYPFELGARPAASRRPVDSRRRRPSRRLHLRPARRLLVRRRRRAVADPVPRHRARSTAAGRRAT